MNALVLNGRIGDDNARGFALIEQWRTSHGADFVDHALDHGMRCPNDGAALYAF